jgi:transcriptional regulator with XRE-family HTH domain
MSRPRKDQDQKARGKRLADKIKASRGSKITQEQLAQMAGVSLDTLRKLERGAVAAPNVFLIADLAIALNEKIEKWLD